MVITESFLLAHICQSQGLCTESGPRHCHKYNNQQLMSKKRRKWCRRKTKKGKTGSKNGTTDGVWHRLVTGYWSLFQSQTSVVCRRLCLLVPPPGSVQFDAEAREVVQLLQVEPHFEAIYEAVFWVQAETHCPEDQRVVLAQEVERVHQLLEVWVGIHHVCCQDVVKTVRGSWETLLHVWTPG